MLRVPRYFIITPFTPLSLLQISWKDCKFLFTAPKMTKSSSKSAWDKLGVKTCDNCSFRSSEPGIFQAHVCRTVGTTAAVSYSVSRSKFCCSLCRVELAENAFEEHLELHMTAKPYSCYYCSQLFGTREEVYVHVQKHINNADIRKIGAQWCNLRVSKKTKEIMLKAKNRSKCFFRPLNANRVPIPFGAAAQSIDHANNTRTTQFQKIAPKLPRTIFPSSSFHQPPGGTVELGTFRPSSGLLPPSLTYQLHRPVGASSHEIFNPPSTGRVLGQYPSIQGANLHEPPQVMQSHVVNPCASREEHKPVCEEHLGSRAIKSEIVSETGTKTEADDNLPKEKVQGIFKPFEEGDSFLVLMRGIFFCLHCHQKWNRTLAFIKHIWVYHLREDNSLASPNAKFSLRSKELQSIMALLRERTNDVQLSRRISKYIIGKQDMETSNSTSSEPQPTNFGLLSLGNPSEHPPLRNPPEPPPHTNLPESPPHKNALEQLSLRDPSEPPPHIDLPESSRHRNPLESSLLRNPSDHLPLRNPPEPPPHTNSPEPLPHRNPQESSLLRNPMEHRPLRNPLEHPHSKTNNNYYLRDVTENANSINPPSVAMRHDTEQVRKLMTTLEEPFGNEKENETEDSFKKSKTVSTVGTGNHFDGEIVPTSSVSHCLESNAGSEPGKLVNSACDHMPYPKHSPEQAPSPGTGDKPYDCSTNTAQILDSQTVRYITGKSSQECSDGGHGHLFSAFYQCGFYDCVFSSHLPVELLFHNETVHPNMDGRIPCVYCGKMNETTRCLLEHMDSHVGRSGLKVMYKCSLIYNSKAVCVVEHRNMKKVFDLLKIAKTKKALSQEQDNVIQYRCNLCHLDFQSLEDLRMHLNKSLLKVVACKFCRGHFLDSGSFHEHMTRDHPHEVKQYRINEMLLCMCRKENASSYDALLSQRKEFRSNLYQQQNDIGSAKMTDSDNGLSESQSEKGEDLGGVCQEVESKKSMSSESCVHDSSLKATPNSLQCNALDETSKQGEAPKATSLIPCSAPPVCSHDQQIETRTPGDKENAEEHFSTQQFLWDELSMPIHFRCSICPCEKFSSYFVAKKHQKTHTETKSVIRRIPSFKFDSQRKYKCHFCPYTCCGDKAMMLRHLRASHKIFECGHCGKDYMVLPFIENHLKYHHKGQEKNIIVRYPRLLTAFKLLDHDSTPMETNIETCSAASGVANCASNYSHGRKRHGESENENLDQPRAKQKFWDDIDSLGCPHVGHLSEERKASNGTICEEERSISVNTPNTCKTHAEKDRCIDCKAEVGSYRRILKATRIRSLCSAGSHKPLEIRSAAHLFHMRDATNETDRPSRLPLLHANLGSARCTVFDANVLKISQPNVCADSEAPSSCSGGRVLEKVAGFTNEHNSSDAEKAMSTVDFPFQCDFCKVCMKCIEDVLDHIRWLHANDQNGILVYDRRLHVAFTKDGLVKRARFSEFPEEKHFCTACNFRSTLR